MDFGNASQSDEGNKIVKFRFKSDLRIKFVGDVKPHQQEGVQGSPEFVSLHREGFATMGSMTDQAEVNEIIRKNLDHNLGFSSKHKDRLKKELESWDVVATQEQQDKSRGRKQRGLF